MHRREGQARRHLIRLRDDSGSVAVETVIVFPVVLLLIFGAIQAGLYYYGRTTALAAAQQGVQASRVENGSATAGTAAARNFLAGPSSLLRNVTVTPSRDAVNTTVTVAGTIPTLLPGFTFTVTQTATGTVERVTTRTAVGAG